MGSTSVTLNAAGQRRYEAYGQGRWSRGEEQTDFGFNSHREESEFGLYDYQARYFSPLLGRFISADTIVPDFSNPQSLNRYAYVYNNPLKYTDPSGHCPLCIGIGLAAAYLFFSNEMAVGEDAPAYTPVQNYATAAKNLTLAGDVEDAYSFIQDPTMVDGGLLIMSMALPEALEAGAKRVVLDIFGDRTSAARHLGEIVGKGKIIEHTVSRKGQNKAELLFDNRNDAMTWSGQQLGPSAERMYDASGKWIGLQNLAGDKVYWGHGDWGKGIGKSTFAHLNYDIGGVKGHLYLEDKIRNRGEWEAFADYFGLEK